MDASLEPHDADRNAVRSRSAPEFCRPQLAKPQPYQSRSAGIAQPKTAQPTPETRPQSAFRSPSSASAPAPGHTESAPSFGSVRSVWGPEEVPDREEDSADRSEAGWIAIGRGVALMIGTLLLVDLFAAGGLDSAGPWWLDIRPLPVRASAGLLGTAAGCLLMFAIRGSLPRGIRGVGLLCVGLLIALAVKNATVYYGLLKRGDLHEGPPVAFSLHVIGCLGMILLAMRSAPGVGGLRGTFLAFVGCGAAVLSFPIAHIACQGTIDSRRSAAVAIVAGPRMYEVDANARIQQRIDRAVELHEAGLVPSLVLTATANDEQLASMKERALAAGVPAEEIEVVSEEHLGEVLSNLGKRYQGINGQAPVFLVVSDPDHLPRLLLAGRGGRVRLEGVPSGMEDRPARSVYVRELTALWRVYLRR